MNNVLNNLHKIEDNLERIDLINASPSANSKRIDAIQTILHELIGAIQADLDGVDLEDDAQGAN